MNSLIERTLGAWLSRLGQSDMFNSEARGYIGIIGAVMALLSIRMPFVSAWPIHISYFDLLFAKEVFFPVIIIIVLLAALCLYVARLQGLAFPTAVIFSITFVISGPSLLSEADIDLDFFVRTGSGLYVMVIGLILMILSPFLWRINEKIEALFHAPQSKTAK